MKKFLIVLAVLFVIFLVVAVGMYGFVKNNYNNLVTLDEGVKSAWAQVENVLQRRFDLIPNLVATVKGYAAHENDVLTQVTEARSRVGGAGSQSARMQAEGELSGALSRLMVVVENYPELKANQNFIMLQDQLEGTENRIAVERQRYNDIVQQYNTTIRRFPTSLIAGFFKFEKKDFFESAPGAEQAPKVSFEK